MPQPSPLKPRFRLAGIYTTTDKIRDENNLWLQASLHVLIFLSVLWGTVYRH
jgi:hypothetical protein